MIRRAVALILLVWLLGYAVFVVTLPSPAAATHHTDAIVVPTGWPGRITRGADLLQARAARRMLISGVGTGATKAALASENHLPRALFDCCVDLGREADYTRDNADETVKWLQARRYRTVRLVTTDWHMPRARFELVHAGVAANAITVDAVPDNAAFSVLMREYNKYIVRRIAAVAGL